MARNILLVVVFCSVNTALSGDDSRVLWLGIGVLREQATFVVLPEYPTSSSSAGRAGRVVVEVRVSERGKVLHVHVLETPDHAIGLAVESAVMRWSFRPFAGGGKQERFSVQSRLIFYFSLVNGKPVVIDAAAEAVAMHKKARR